MNINFFKKLFILLIFLFTNSKLSSQVINVESKRQSQEKGISGVVEFAFDYKKSKNLDWEFTSVSYVQWDNFKWSVLLLNEINLDRAGGVDFSNDGYQHLRLSRHLNSIFTIESFLQNQFDPVRDIKNRKLGGVGLRCKIIKNHFIGLSSFYENEVLESDIKSNTIRLNAYLRLKFEINQNISLSSITYFQPDLFRLCDYKISNDNIIIFNINERFSFSNSIEISYDVFPAKGIPKIIYAIQNGLSFNF